MSWAMEAVGSDEPIQVDHLLSIHGCLLAGARPELRVGQIRNSQNWIGGSSYNPCSADFVPPPPEHVMGLLEDLCAFCNDDSVSAVIQAALAHAQFETIHPFVDGNGRIGRVLIQMILRRRGLAPYVIPPVSLVLASWTNDYLSGLTSTRYQGPPGSPQAREGLDRWIALFAAATRRCVADAQGYEDHVAELQNTWRDRLGGVRANSAVELLINALPAVPIVTVQSAATTIGRSEQAVNEAVRRLIHAGVLKQTTVGRRNRAFEAAEVIDAFTDLERRLASPEADTRSSPPARPVPYLSRNRQTTPGL
jgi:Fic family protein